MMSGSEGKAGGNYRNRNNCEEDLGVAEEASPISSRPPAGSSAAAARWPRQETLCLLSIRSQMDSAFRDSSILKAPLWEHISRKLGEMGYIRSGKKCKEKFENIQKYYKRTKERHAQDHGKNYKFFSELDALHRISTRDISLPSSHVLHDPRIAAAGNIGFSRSSSSRGEEGDETESPLHESQKRKRSDYSVDGDHDDRMMEFIVGLMNQVMQKQDAMQQRFLDAIEKTEQDRMAREEAWKRQDSARLIRHHHLMSQERATVASRDSAIIACLQKLTGQTINLPATSAIDPLRLMLPRDQPALPPQNPSHQLPLNPPEYSPSSHSVPDIVETVPEQRKMLQEAVSSRWPKVQVLALIQLRSNLDSRYQDAGPKAPLWEDIASGMQRLGYNRSSKRCKEKWENLNKYYKKVKENNKRSPEDTKTCPYFHELDALYTKKILGNTGRNAGGSSVDVLGSFPQKQQSLQIKESQGKDGADNNPKVSSIPDLSSLFDEHKSDQATITRGEKQQPVDFMRTQDRQRREKLMDYFCDGSSSDDEDEYGDDEERMKLAYGTQFKSQQNVGTGNIHIFHTIVR